MIQKSFGEFIRERYGRNWVYAARSTPRILAQYQKYNPETGEYEPPVVITPKQQRELAVDYAKAWGREYDRQYWAMLCALRETAKQVDFCGFDVQTKMLVLDAIDLAEKEQKLA